MNENSNTAAGHEATGKKVITNYNLIILDRSGSMSSIRKYAVDAVNETIASMRARQQAHEADEKSMVTLVAFCSCSLQVIYNNVPVEEAKPLTLKDYRPCCCTPLYDAIGNNITRLHDMVGDDNNTTVQVTIITDGYENSSREFSHKAIKSLIEAYKKEGWMFAYMGADHDVESVAYGLSIDNALEFEKSQTGVRGMAIRFSECCDAWTDDQVAFMRDESTSDEEKIRKRIARSSRFFEE